jgi:hypothetical protein
MRQLLGVPLHQFSATLIHWNKRKELWMMAGLWAQAVSFSLIASMASVV